MSEKQLYQTRTTIRKVLIYLKKYWLLCVFSVLFAFFSVVLSLYLPIQIGYAVDCVLAPGKVDFRQLGTILGNMAMVILFTAIFQWLMNTCNNRITFQVVKDIRKQAFDRLEELPLQYVDTHPYGDLISRIVTDVDQFSDGLLMGFTQLFTGVTTILGTLLIMVNINYKIAMVVILITPLSLFVAAFISKKTYDMFLRQSKIRGAMTTHIDEMIGNEKIVQAFSYEDDAIERFDEINIDLQKCSLDAIFYSSITNPATRFVNGLVYAGVGIFGALSAMNGGGISVGQLTSFLSYANQYTKPFNEISGVITELQNALSCAARVFELMETEMEIPEPKDVVVLTNAQGNVTLDQVSFRYNPEKKLIEDLNLNILSGQRVAIVGPTGCGKSTVINLLMRFYDVNKGTISVDGTDIRKLTRKSLRESYGMVLQETWLRNGTIRDNIRFARPNATEDEIIGAAKESHAHSFIRRLPQGYDTVIQEDGGNLSQGQKQLLCITRVMLCLPPMLILDEATSSIDTRTEIQIQKAFAKMMKGRTSFVVAHRLSTIKESDVILVMQDGRIVEQGKHKDLLEQNGYYAELFQSQFAI